MRKIDIESIKDSENKYWEERVEKIIEIKK